MFGHRWEAAEATIVLVHPKKTTGDGMVTINEYVADVAGPTGLFRATVQEPGISTNFWAPRAGDVVGVLVDAKNGKVKFDKDDERLDAKARRAAPDRRFQQARDEGPGAWPGTAGR